nr:retrovirus-related Pol polyprotein from transposon TNT 1-94 [Tanacetum cinerariifolium]
MAEKKVIIKPIDYVVLNQLSKDFETRFVPQTELSAEQAFWSRYSVQLEESNLSASTTIVEVPKELPKVSLVNSSLKRLKFHLASFDMVVKERTTATVITEGTWGFEHTKAFFRDDIILFVKALKELFNSFDQFLINELSEVQQVTKLVAKNEHLKQTYKQLYDSIKSSRVRSKEQCDDLINKVNLKSAEVSDLNASLQEKVLVITALKETISNLKGKKVVTEAVSLNPIDHELLKIDVAPLAPKLRKNRTAHTDYIRHTQEETATLREIVESEKLLNPLNTSLDYASCAMGKSTKKTHKPKSEDTNQEKLYLLHMDLYGPIRVESVNGKKYILVIVDDYSRFSWVKFLRSKDETLDFIIKFLKMIQVRLKVPVRRIRTVNGTEFVNQTLCDYYEEVGISHETSIACSLQQNGVIERRNNTLIKVARTMLIYAQAPLFLWAEAMATACFTQNRSIIRLRHGKTPYELLHSKLPDLSFFHVFGALCYLTNDSENLGKLQPKADIGMFIGYTPTKKAFRIYNLHTRRIVETIHIDFDELKAMASEQSSSGHALNEMTPGTISSGHVQKSSPSTSYVPPSKNDWDLLFQLMFNELLNPPPSVVNQAPKVIAPIAEVIPLVHADSIGSHSSTTVDQDAPFSSKSHTTTKYNPQLFVKMLEMTIWIW